MSFRPQVIRADTIDLQNPEAPSAQDHTNQPSHPQPRGFGPAAPHQNAELRHMAEERNEEEYHLNEIWNSGQGNTSDNAELFLGPDASQNGSRFQPQSSMEISDAQSGPEEPDFGDGDEPLDESGPMDDKMSSSPSIADEDIDFEFVYALHNFVATVEGQANANKGDTMVLLDDTNSYWWLVRLMRDNSIGYLPAEHIETPTERLARLNKHRNIDLSASMLGDNAEKSKNPLKKAMRRRNAKMVAFTTPTYYEPTVEWSDNEDIDRIESDEVEGRRKGGQLDRDDGHPQGGQLATNDINLAASLGAPLSSDRESLENALDSPDVARTRAPLRNTDSFLKDDATRKLTLTPDLLRDDSSRASLRSPEPRTGSPDMYDQLGRLSPTSEKAAEDKKKKEKKPNMLSGLFKRKDKKIKVDEAAGSIVARQDDNGATIYSPASTDRSSPSSGRSSPSGIVPPSSLRIRKPESNSKLNNVSQTGISSPIDNVPRPGAESVQSLRGRATTPEPRVNPVRSEEPTLAEESFDERSSEQTDASQSTVAALGPGSVDSSTRRSTSDELQLADSQLIPQPPGSWEEESFTEVVTSLKDEDIDRPIATETPALPSDAADVARRNSVLMLSDLGNIARRPSADAQAPPEGYTTRAAASAPSIANTAAAVRADPTEALGHQPGRSIFAVAPSNPPPTSAPPPIPVPKQGFSFPPRTPINEAHWDNATLHTYLERSGSSIIKDMLIVLSDKSGVVPLPNDHPTMVELGFVEKQRQLDSLSKQLDALMVGYVERKRRAVQAKEVR